KCLHMHVPMWVCVHTFCSCLFNKCLIHGHSTCAFHVYFIICDGHKCVYILLFFQMFSICDHSHSPFFGKCAFKGVLDSVHRLIITNHCIKFNTYSCTL